MSGLAALILGIVTVSSIIGCGGGSPPPPVPVISNINSSTTPTSPVGSPIAINGSAFQSAPGTVVFTQGSISATVVPSTAGWSDTGVVAVVPAGNGTTNFTVPGTVSVTVVTSGGTSNAVTVNLIQRNTFLPGSLTWTQTTALPTALSGLRAVAVQASNTSAFVIVAGGFNGAANVNANVNTVLTNTLAQDGTLGPTWTPSTNLLPTTLAHFGMVEADPTNSPVASGARFVYVIGGQKDSREQPGGTNTVFMASVDPNTGTVGTWTPLTSTLPQTLVGPAAAAFNGYIYVVGGLMSNGSPSNAVYSASIKSDGTLGAWTPTNAYPTAAVSFATAFGFGGILYVLNGDPNGSTNPNSQGTAGVQNVNFASTSRGVVGTWSGNTNQTNNSRLKHIVWPAFGQVIYGEGVYSGTPGSSELEQSQISADGSLSMWMPLTGVNAPNANVYNASAFVSPLLSAAGTPRLLLLGGQSFVTTGTGALSNKVYVNNAP